MLFDLIDHDQIVKPSQGLMLQAENLLEDQSRYTAATEISARTNSSSISIRQVSLLECR